MIRFWSLLGMGICFAFSAQAVDIIKLEDFGKMTKYRDYLVHFSLDDPENAYPHKQVHVTMAYTDTIIRPNSDGEYRLKVWLTYKDTTRYLSIGNIPFTDKKGKYWKQDFCWNTIRSVPYEKVEGPQNIRLPYKHPTMANLLAWTRMSTSEFAKQAEADGLVESDPKHVDEGCIQYRADEFDFWHNYELEIRPDKNRVSLTYGVYSTKYESELDWVKASVASLEAQLKPYFKETKQIGVFPAKIYRFKNNGRIYSIYVIEDEKCVHPRKDTQCYEGWITIRWASEN